MSNMFEGWPMSDLNVARSVLGASGSGRYAFANPIEPSSGSDLASSIGKSLNDGFSSLYQQLQSMIQASSTSAIEAERQAVAQANVFNHNEALLNRQFQQMMADRANAFTQASADKAMQFEAQQAQINRDFQERMSNTQYQRLVQDLKAAGLNPILAYQHLNGSTPSGSVASGSSGSGVAASGSSTSGFKANYSNAKSSDIKMYDYLVPMLAVQAVSTGMDVLNGAFSSIGDKITSASKSKNSFANKYPILYGFAKAFLKPYNQ